MKYSDIVVPAYMNLWHVAYFLPVAGLFALLVMVMIAATGKKRTLGRRAVIALVSVTAGTIIASLALQPAIQGFKDQQDRNFAAALEREYGATSSQTFSEFFGLGGKRVTTLTQDGKSTDVRFEVKDDIIIPLTQSEAPYPTSDGK